MKVLHVISDENIGGAGVLLTTLLRNFDRARVESVVALPEGSLLASRVEGLGIPVCRLQYAPERPSSASVRELSRLIRSEGIDIVHANAALSARLAGKRCGTVVLHTRHCCYPPSGLLRFAAVRRFSGLWNRRLSDLSIATADAAAGDLRMLGMPEDRIRVVLNGSEPVRAVSDAELAAARARWGIGQDDFTVGICARLEPCKGHETFLHAARELIRELPELGWRFLIVGTGSRRKELEDMAALLGISNRVVFTGFVEDMAPVYRLLRVNVNCSSGTETSCLALSEGMSAGVPCAVSDYGGNRDMVGDSMAGVVYPVGDHGALANAIRRIATDPALEATMRRAAYERYSTRYTAKQMTEQVTELYESFCK